MGSNERRGDDEFRPTHGALPVEPYNDFLSEGRKIFPLVQKLAEESGLLATMRSAVNASRHANVRVLYVPHRWWQPGDYDNWNHPHPAQLRIQQRHSFAGRTWAEQWHPDFIPHEKDIDIRLCAAIVRQGRFRQATVDPAHRPVVTGSLPATTKP